jgi:hypothetical protein
MATWLLSTVAVRFAMGTVVDSEKLLPTVATPKPLCPENAYGAPQLRESDTLVVMKEVWKQPLLRSPLGTDNPVELQVRVKVPDAQRFPAIAAKRPVSKQIRPQCISPPFLSSNC